MNHLSICDCAIDWSLAIADYSFSGNCGILSLAIAAFCHWQLRHRVSLK
jgi:hypothetical protein